MKLRGFLIILICALLSAGVSIFVGHFTSFQNKDWWWSLIFFSTIFIITNVVFEHKTDVNSYSEMSFGLIIIKTLFLFVAIFLYSLYNKQELGSFSVHFIAHYILFTLIEIRYLLYLIKNRVI